jgi:hypothetical protein
VLPLIDAETRVCPPISGSRNVMPVGAGVGGFVMLDVAIVLRYLLDIPVVLPESELYQTESNDKDCFQGAKIIRKEG